MKTVRVLIFMGMIGAIIFLVQDTLGTLMWKEYNPISMYISFLTADGAPNLPITRTLYTAHNVSLVLFFVGMCYLAFRFWHPLLKIGFYFLLIALSLSFVGIGSFPMSLENVFAAQNLLHLAFTVGMLIATVLALYVLSVGYQKENRLNAIGRVSFIFAILFTVFNLVLLFVIVEGLNVKGLFQRCGIYTFFTYVFYLSSVFVRRKADDLK